MRALPPATEARFRLLAGIPSLERYLLVGGSALALRLGHRLSQDLDFAQERAPLDRRPIGDMIRRFGEQHIPVARYPHDAGRQGFEDGGLELDDYQQDYDGGGVKLSFFIPEYPRSQTEAVMGKPEPVPGVDSGHIRVAGLGTLALMKSLLLGRRITTRDLFDIVALVRRGALTYRQVFDWQNSRSLGYDWLRSRLLHAAQPKDDPGVEPLDRAIPADFPALKELLVSAMDQYEQAVASEVFRKSKGKSKRPKRR
ncbi:MAG TPA: nucleotidyl transferase AbiEii/AbiGii toxin family protein [Terriglobia bacterium]|nr:nucleotidyl transferase AbiEii/AbiGii toxin family protein [Terriglobia bacterium]